MRRIALSLLVVVLAGWGCSSPDSPESAGDRLVQYVRDDSQQAAMEFVYAVRAETDANNPLRLAVDLCAYRDDCLSLIGDVVASLCDTILPGYSDDDVLSTVQSILQEHFEPLVPAYRSVVSDVLRDTATQIARHSGPGSAKPWCI